MDELADRIDTVQAGIHAAENRYGREPGSVALLAVSKKKPAALIRRAAELGLRSFGENYMQEALAKMDALADLNLDWHFIGPLQSNKTLAIASRFAWVHSVDREKLARRLSAQRPEDMPPLNVCVQVNSSAEASKSGVAPEQVPALASCIEELPGLRLRGLMTIPARETDFQRQRHAFGLVRELLEELRRQGLAVDTLSMGMTADLEAAIAEGSTLVRIGTGIFGPR